jgi:hypothetical protein
MAQPSVRWEEEEEHRQPHLPFIPRPKLSQNCRELCTGPGPAAVGYWRPLLRGKGRGKRNGVHRPGSPERLASYTENET